MCVGELKAEESTLGRLGSAPLLPRPEDGVLRDVWTWLLDALFGSVRLG